MLEPLLTVAEAAAILRVSPRTLKEWCRRGKVTCVKVGREWRLRAADVQAAVKPAPRRGPRKEGQT